MAGCVVLSASDWRRALELSREHQGTIDLAASDVEMPRLQFTDLCST